jgi:hypothetical protein
MVETMKYSREKTELPPKKYRDMDHIRKMKKLIKKEHFFIENENVLDFVESSHVRDDDMKAIQYVILNQIPQNNLLSSPSDETYTHDVWRVVFHLPNRKWYLSVCVNKHIMIGENYHYDVMHIDVTEYKNRFLPKIEINDSGAYYREEDGTSKRPININDYPQVKIVLNSILYMDAFPESVKEGVPNLSVRLPHSNKAKTIAMSDSLRTVYSGNIMPHMRRGHFRFLKSDHYKNKRFQTVYVKPTMVKGSASTLVDTT